MNDHKEFGLYFNTKGNCKILWGVGWVREQRMEKGQEVINILIMLSYSWVDGLVCVFSSSEPGSSSVQVSGREQFTDVGES